MTDTALSIERRGHVVILQNQDPPRNRMTFEYMDELEAAVVALQDDHDARAVVITAAGDEHFSVGMDLKQLMSGADDRGGFEAVLDQRLRAKKIDGPTALAIGLVHELHPVAELKAKAIERYNDNPDATHFFEKTLMAG